MKCKFLALLLVFLGSASVRLLAADPPVPALRAVDVDGKVEIGYGVAVADVDGDKKPDILLADKSLIVWYQNPAWQKHIIAEKLTQLDHVCLAAADLDGDGKCEIAAGAGWNPGDTVGSGAVFYLIPPADRTQRWEPVPLPHEPTVHRMRWVRNWDGKYRLVVVPLHGRGNKGGQGEGVKILAYQRPENPRQPWTTTVLDASLHLTHNFDPVQWDDDVAQELLIAGKEGVFLLNRVDEQIKLIQLGGNEPGETAFIGAGEVRQGRLPGGKRFIATVEPMHGNQVVTYTPPDSASGKKLWLRRVIDESIVDGHAVACGDLLRAGYDQLVVGWRAMNRPGVKVGIKLYIPLDADGKNWNSVLLDDNTMACEDLTLADLNGDGRLDIVAAGRATKNLKVDFNER
ncbi:MAG: FG-GAP repeat protein [Chloroflexi bacterium]|nr:FG-GAP repeat protein [Chloroflexota bacterium]